MFCPASSLCQLLSSLKSPFPRQRRTPTHMHHQLLLRVPPVVQASWPLAVCDCVLCPLQLTQWSLASMTLGWMFMWCFFVLTAWVILSVHTNQNMFKVLLFIFLESHRVAYSLRASSKKRSWDCWQSSDERKKVFFGKCKVQWEEFFCCCCCFFAELAEFGC